MGLMLSCSSARLTTCGESPREPPMMNTTRPAPRSASSDRCAASSYEPCRLPWMVMATT